MKIKNISIPDQIYNKLVTDIISGKLLPGDKISEEGLSKIYGVSRTPIREALLSLTNEELLERIPNRGCFVKKVDDQSRLELFYARKEVECSALLLGFDNIIIEDVKELYEYLQSLKSDKKINISRVDEKMHSILCSPCKNRYLLSIIDKLKVQSRPFRTSRILKEDDWTKINLERINILKAVLSGDKTLSIELLGKHILGAAEC